MSGTANSREDRGRLQGFDALHARMLSNFADLVDELGGNTDALLADVEGTLSKEGDVQHATYRQFVRLLELAAERLGCVDFGMRLAVRQAQSVLDGMLGMGMRSSQTLHEALRFASSHSYAHSLAAWIWHRPSLSHDSMVVGHDILLEGLPRKSQAMEYILLAGNLAILELTAGQVRGRKILFRHQPLSATNKYRQYFGCEVRFGRNADAVIYHSHDLACPIPRSDRVACQAAARMIESSFALHTPPLSANVRGVVFHLLGTELCDRSNVATALNMHPRSMLRRLAEEGLSFQQVKDQVRRDRLLYYLGSTRIAFSEIAEKIGFSEQSVMTRCCHKWFGRSPTQLRVGLQKPALYANGASVFAAAQV